MSSSSMAKLDVNVPVVEVEGEPADPAGTLTALLRDEPDASDTTLSYTLDSRGRPWRVTQDGGSVVESLYDETGFRTRVRVYDDCPMACGTVIHELTFTPDERGRLATVTASFRAHF